MVHVLSALETISLKEEDGVDSPAVCAFGEVGGMERKGEVGGRRRAKSQAFMPSQVHPLDFHCQLSRPQKGRDRTSTTAVFRGPRGDNTALRRAKVGPTGRTELGRTV